MLLWIGFSAWRAASGAAASSARPSSRRCWPSRSAPRSTGSGRSPALGAIFFLAAGVAGRARDASNSRAAAGTPATGEARFGLAVAGAGAVAWIAAIALVGPLLVEHEIKQASSAAADGDITSAIDHADTARSIEPWAASPYVQLGLIAERQGEYPRAIERLTQAIEREDRNWQLYYLRSRVEHEAGEPGRGAEPTSNRRALNPLEPACSRKAGWRMTPRQRRRPAARRRAAAPRAGRRSRADRARVRLGPDGAEGSRRRGALLRRLLATGDWLALIGALCLPPRRPPRRRRDPLLGGAVQPGLDPGRSSSTASTTTTTAASATAPSTSSGPDLGQRPRHAGPRRPAGAEPGRAALAGSAILVGVGALARQLHRSRGVLRFLWHRLAGVATGLVIGPADAVDVIARRVATHPETRLHLVGYLGAARRGPRRRPALPRLGTIDDISRVARRAGHRAGDRHRAGDERAGGRAADRAVQGGRPGAHLPSPALRPARPRHRAQPPRRAAGPRLPLLRPAALDGGDEAGDGRDRLGAAADPALAPAGGDRGPRSCSTPAARSSSASAGRARTASPSRCSSSARWSPTPRSGSANWSTSRSSTSPPSRSPTTHGSPGPAAPAADQPRRAAAAGQRPARRHVAGRPAARGGGDRRPLRRAPARSASRSSPG